MFKKGIVKYKSFDNIIKVSSFKTESIVECTLDLSYKKAFKIT